MERVFGILTKLCDSGARRSWPGKRFEEIEKNRLTKRKGAVIIAMFRPKAACTL